MTNLLNDFMSMDWGVRVVFLFWGVCVVTFYSTLVYGVGIVLFNNLKRLTNG